MREFHVRLHLKRYKLPGRPRCFPPLEVRTVVACFGRMGGGGVSRSSASLHRVRRQGGGQAESAR
ncbi:hypothetical protein SATRM34S_00825 [Streptomyces atroolivaceus]